jgi:hypothetical protein
VDREPVPDEAAELGRVYTGRSWGDMLFTLSPDVRGVLTFSELCEREPVPE